jgi:HPr kinase/phosphorylase
MAGGLWGRSLSQRGERVQELQVLKLLEEEGKELHLKSLTPDSLLSNVISSKDLHRPGLALAGYLDLFTHNRVQVLGNTECSYLNSLDGVGNLESLSRFFKHTMPVIILTDSNKAPDSLVELSEGAGTPVLSTDLDTTTLHHLLSDYLDDFFSPSDQLHATLIDVHGTGILITGKSGIGKSEVGLDLIERGHRLVADDVVRVNAKAGHILMGSGVELLQHMMEIRGLGIIDVRQIFGVASVRMQKRVEMVIELCLWEDRQNLDRTGLENETLSILGVKLPLIRLPIFPGKNITVICETLALNHHLKVYGYDSAEEINRRLLADMESRTKLKSYLRKDSE